MEVPARPVTPFQRAAAALNGSNGSFSMADLGSIFGGGADGSTPFDFSNLDLEAMLAEIQGKTADNGDAAATPEDEKKPKGVLGWLREFFSVATLIRGVAILVGVVLIILSIAILVGRAQTGQALVTNTVRKVAGPKAAGAASEVASNVVEFAAAA